MLDCWAYGDRLREWFIYRPSEILTENPDITRNLFFASQELRDAVPKIVDAYPCILETAPDLLKVCQMAADSQQESPTMTMSM